MSAERTVPRMSVEAFFDWADRQEGRFELDDGVIVAMAPERLLHTRTKASAYLALARAVSKAGRPCEVFMDGPGVRIDASTSYRPDVTVQCGARLPGDVREIDAVIVVEVLSPSTAYRDLGRKARNYFRVPSIAHYLVIDADDRIVTHHRRDAEGAVTVRPLASGDLMLDPPGLSVVVADLLSEDGPVPG